MTIMGELAAVVSELEGAGIIATTHPGDFWAYASSSDASVALVGAPEEVQLVKLPGILRMTVPVTLAARGPDTDAYPRLFNDLPTLLRALRPLEAARPERYRRGDVSMAAYRIDCSRDVED